MENSEGNKKRIAKNTILLYIRMAIIMIVSLYTTRVVIAMLGVSDYGIYSLVGSVVVSLVFIQNSLNNATQRFISYEIGQGESEVQAVFSASMNIHLLFVICSIVLFETVGVWFLQNVLSIPEGREQAAFIVYQLSVLTFCFNLLRIPYNAIIISYEKMDIYAVLSIVEAFLKLVIVFLLKAFSWDKLVLFAVLTMIVTVIINLCFIIYCKKTFREKCKYKYIKNNDLLKRMLGFSNWNLVGGVSGVASGEGPNYLVNIFLGVQVNAAVGIAKQVGNAVYSFTSNFQTAFNPQIIKSYSSGDKVYMHDLMFSTSKLSFYLMFIFGFPVILLAEQILNIWLVEVPKYTVIFCQLTLISEMITALSGPLWMAVHAVGDIKKYQLTISLMNIFIIPIAYGILKLDYPPYWIFISKILLNIIIFIYRLLFVGKKILFPINRFLKEVVLKCCYLTLLIVPIPLIMVIVMKESMINTFIQLAVAGMIELLVIYYLGIEASMRMKIKSFILNKLHNAA